MSQVAKAAGVSLATVSHVLNHTRHVSDHTRANVLSAVDLLGYYDRRVESARDIRKVIGVMVPSTASPFFGEVLDGLDAEASRIDATLLISVSNEDPVKETAGVQALAKRDVDALIVIPTVGWRDRTRPLLKSIKAATVLVDRLEDPSFDQVGSESVAATQTVVSHLITQGHTRIGMIQGLLGLTTSRERETGFRLAHERHGLPVDPSLIWQGRSTVRGGYHAALGLLHSPHRPTALFCSNNNMTVGLLEALRREKVQVPQDLAFVTFDDLEWGSLLDPPITSVAQPFHAMGSKAVQLVLDRLREPQRPRQTVRLPCSIEHRRSCGCTNPHPLELSQ